MSTPRKTTKAKATQTSASNSIASALQHGGHRFGHRLLTRDLPDEPLDNGAGRVFCNAANIAHRSLLGRRDGPLGLCKSAIELVLKRFAARLGLRRLLLARFVRDRLRTRTRIGERLLVRRDSCLRFFLQPVRFGDIISNALLPAVD